MLAAERDVVHERFGFAPFNDHLSSTERRYGTVLDQTSCALRVCPPEDEK
jgi:hypothetical protein